jgi:hypothetical protein
MAEQIKFAECDACRATPGSPILCTGCLHNRDVVMPAVTEALEAMAWIRRKLKLSPDAKMFEGAPNTIAGELHVLCNDSHGYRAYIAAFKCDDKQGEIARLTRLVDQLRDEKLHWEIRAERAEHVLEVVRSLADDVLDDMSTTAADGSMVDGVETSK